MLIKKNVKNWYFKNMLVVLAGENPCDASAFCGVINKTACDAHQEIIKPDLLTSKYE